MSKDRKQLPTSNPFKEAVEATPEIKNCYQPGLQALGSYSTKIELLNNRECNGSVEIDECVRPNYPTANRWDYVVSYKSAAYFIEVHSAETSEVSVVLTKLQWLKDWLYKYVLVDEFQDVNNLQVALIKLLLHPETQLFCVGDDWQSIYGFRGSNVDYIIGFEKHFSESTIIKLNLNYRSTPDIVGASNEVIKHNKYKIEKEIFASKSAQQKIEIHAGADEEENVRYCVQKVQTFLEAGIPPEEILFLYRRSKMMHPFFEELKKAGVYVPYKTIHAAKGLEARVVFIIGLTDGPGGFPDVWLEDRIYKVIKQSNLDSLLEEERRLFYVALTRAKDILFLITEKGRMSPFLKEIPDEYIQRTDMPFQSVVEEVRLCPECRRQIEPAFSYCPFCGGKQ